MRAAELREHNEPSVRSVSLTESNTGAHVQTSLYLTGTVLVDFSPER